MKKLIFLALLASMCAGCGTMKEEIAPDEIYHAAFPAAPAVEKEVLELPERIEEYRERQEETAVQEFEENEELLEIEQVLYAAPDDYDLDEELYYDSLETLAICVMAEAGNQDLDGMRMVADVILNRVDDADFPDTIEGVISQKYQFSSYWDGGMQKWNVPSEQVYKACQMELKNRSYPGLIYFCEGGYSRYGTPAFKHGDHYFSTK